MLVALLVALRLIEDHRHGVRADGLAQAGLCRGARHRQAQVAEQWHHKTIEDLALTRAGTGGEPEVGPPAQGSADRSQHHPALQQGAGGGHFPAKAVGNADDHRRFLHGQGLDAAGPLLTFEALVDVPRTERLGDRVLPLGGDQTIAEVQHGAAPIPPGPAAANALHRKDPHRSGGLVQIAGRCRPVHTCAAGVKGLPMLQRCQGDEVGGGVAAAGQPDHLAGAGGLIEIRVGVVAQAEEGCCWPGGRRRR